MNWRESVAKNLPPGSVGFVGYFPDKIESNNEKETETPALNGCSSIKKTSKKGFIEDGNITHKGPQNPQNPETSLCGQKSFDEIPQHEPHREERRDPAGEKPTASPIVKPGSPNAEILNRLGIIAVRAVQFAGKLKAFSPEQNKIAGLLDQAHEIKIAEPLDTVKLARVIGELMAATSQKPGG